MECWDALINRKIALLEAEAMVGDRVRWRFYGRSLFNLHPFPRIVVAGLGVPTENIYVTRTNVLVVYLQPQLILIQVYVQLPGLFSINLGCRLEWLPNKFMNTRLDNLDGNNKIAMRCTVCIRELWQTYFSLVTSSHSSLLLTTAIRLIRFVGPSLP